MGPFILGAIPFCGFYIFPFWTPVLKVLAYRALHKTTGGKATAAALIPSALAFSAYLLWILRLMGKTP